MKERLRKRDPRRARRARTSSTDAEEIARHRGADPARHDLLGPARHRQDAASPRRWPPRIGAAITVVSGPELKIEVGRRERREPARRSSTRPASRRRRSSSSTSSTRSPPPAAPTPARGVEHSMVNQLLTEMDGFHKEELVFVVGTTNFVEIARPGAAAARAGSSSTSTSRIPDADDRRAILEIYDKKMGLEDDAERARLRGAAHRRPRRGHAAAPATPATTSTRCAAQLARMRLRENVERRRPSPTTSSAR